MTRFISKWPLYHKNRRETWLHDFIALTTAKRDYLGIIFCLKTFRYEKFIPTHSNPIKTSFILISIHIKEKENTILTLWLSSSAFSILISSLILLALFCSALTTTTTSPSSSSKYPSPVSFTGPLPFAVSSRILEMRTRLPSDGCCSSSCDALPSDLARNSVRPVARLCRLAAEVSTSVRTTGGPPSDILLIRGNDLNDGWSWESVAVLGESWGSRVCSCKIVFGWISVMSKYLLRNCVCADRWN